MPVYANHVVVEIARGVKAFLSLKAGVVRGEVTDLDMPGADPRAASRIEALQKSLAARDRRISRLERGFAGGRVNAFKPGNIVWIFGTARTGSTWLGSMMESLEDHAHWREPYVGALFGNLYYTRPEHQRRNEHYILGRHKKSWLNSIRSFVLDGASARFPDLGAQSYLVVKEPHGSVGAPLLMEALPESRMIFLLRDPRDVVSSGLDSKRKGSWVYERRRERFGAGETLGDVAPDEIVRSTARTYLRDIGNVRDAYRAHEGCKVLVKYEDLRADTLETMKRIYAALEIPVDERALANVVREHSFENIPAEEKGEGKFYRKAAPGGWREDLTPEQVKIVEETTAPLLEEFYER